MPPTNSQVDPTALALSRAIRATEGGDYTNTSGDAGTSAGAYQWNNGKIPLQKGQVPANFKSAAQQFGLDPNDFSPTNQDHVAYMQIKHDLDSGLSQSSVSAKWNSGLTHGWEDHKGTTTINGKTISYDTPAYVAKVQHYYQNSAALPDNKGYNPHPFSTAAPGQFNFSGTAPAPETSPDNTSLGGQLTGRANDLSHAISDTTTGKINPVSGLLQGAGALAGGVGDVVNKGLELIPGVKQVENLLGQGVGSLMSTPTGQAVAQNIKDFSEKHPELSKDIGAGFNIITALPILRGLGAVGGVAMDGVSQALKGVAEKSANEGLTKVVSSTINGRKALQFNPNGVKTLVDERALPDVENGKYIIKDASENLDTKIHHIDTTELEPALDAGTTKGVSDRIPLEVYKKNAMAEAVANLKDPAPIEAAFKRIEAKYGDYLTAKQMNEAKRLVSHNITEAGYMSPTYSTDKIVRSTLQTAVEDWGKTSGNVDIQAINAKMRELLQAQKLLKYINGKPVKAGLLGEGIKIGAGAAGEALGSMTGVPLIGAYGAYKGTGLLEKAFAGHNLKTRILKSTGKDAVHPVGTAKKVKGLLGGAAAQKVGNARQ